MQKVGKEEEMDWPGNSSHRVKDCVVWWNSKTLAYEFTDNANTACVSVFIKPHVYQLNLNQIRPFSSRIPDYFNPEN